MSTDRLRCPVKRIVGGLCHFLSFSVVLIGQPALLAATVVAAVAVERLALSAW